jgi:hypothetical protein
VCLYRVWFVFCTKFFLHKTYNVCEHSILCYQLRSRSSQTTRRGKALRHRDTDNVNTGCFKTSFTTLKAYIILFRGYVQCFELP